MQNLCHKCGQPAKVFQIQSMKHICEQCTLNEIYTQQESYDDIVKKVIFKMTNIVKIRQKKLLSSLTKQQGIITLGSSQELFDGSNNSVDCLGEKAQTSSETSFYGHLVVESNFNPAEQHLVNNSTKQEAASHRITPQK